MNLVSETNERLSKSNKMLENLIETLNVEWLTKDAEHYLRDEIKKTQKNINYYLKILEVLEKVKEDKSE